MGNILHSQSVLNLGCTRDAFFKLLKKIQYFETRNGIIDETKVLIDTIRVDTISRSD